MAGFTKLFSGLVHSTVWREEMHVKVVWITMLALADRNGHVLASMPGLADAARVSLDQCQEALDRLSAPDKHSRTKAHGGRRIKEVDGGWALLNYKKYREMRDQENRRQQLREAQARYRAKKDVISVSHGKPQSSQAEAEVEAEREAETDVVSGQVVRSSPPAYPPEQRAENATKETIHGLQLRLGGLLCQLSEHENSRLMVPAWCRKVTSYKAKRNNEERVVRGVADYRTLTSIDRLEKSIADSEWWLEELEKREVSE